MIEKWEECGCPGAPFSLASNSSEVYLGFSTRGVSSIVNLDRPTSIIPAPDSGKPRTRPGVAVAEDGTVLFCWTEAQDVVWQAYNRTGRPLPNIAGRLQGVAAKWSNAAVVAKKDNNFILYYDAKVVPNKTNNR